jgi:hypothetical protein
MALDTGMNVEVRELTTNEIEVLSDESLQAVAGGFIIGGPLILGYLAYRAGAFDAVDYKHLFE